VAPELAAAPLALAHAIIHLFETGTRVDVPLDADSSSS
jgi:hypothetical protein